MQFLSLLWSSPLAQNDMTVRLGVRGRESTDHVADPSLHGLVGLNKGNEGGEGRPVDASHLFSFKLTPDVH